MMRIKCNISYLHLVYILDECNKSTFNKSREHYSISKIFKKLGLASN